ncbi:Uncharacterized protein Adt_45113 [Abeliophyllum distichum]|uniref:Uncharacterized protein n=1 Tax=Abeliophyllum distichum TaxID=126358 RepID=A0ABD1PE76_9LAMI
MKLIFKGLRWRVENSENIQIFHHPWLPRPQYFWLYIASSTEVEKMSDPSPPIEDWDWEQINIHVLSVDCEIISSIPLSFNIIDDTLIWQYEKRNKCSVWNGYRVLCSNFHSQEGSSETRVEVESGSKD